MKTLIWFFLILVAAIGAYGIGAAYFGLHGWQLAIMPVGAVLLGLSIMKD